MAREVNAGRAVVEVSLRDRVGRGLVAIERRLASFGRSVATFGAAMAASGLATVWPLKLAGDMEQTAVAFEVMTGSAAQAKALLDQMKTFAANTPFGFTDVAEAGKLLMNYGITANDVLPILKMLGDVSLGNSERMHLLALAFGQVVSRGKLTGDNLKQLTENGFNPLRQMAVDMAKRMVGASGAIGSMAGQAGKAAAAAAGAAAEGGKMASSAKGTANAAGAAADATGKMANANAAAGQQSAAMAAATAANSAMIERLADRNMPKLIQAMEEGKISVGDVVRAFQTATSAGGRFNNSMSRQSQTGLGLFAKLIETATYAATDFGMVILDALKPVLSIAIDVAEGLQGIIRANMGIVKAIGLAAVGLVVFGAALTAAGLSGSALALVVGGIAALVKMLAASFALLFSPMGLLVVSLIAAGVAAWTFRSQIYSAFAGIIEPVRAAMASIGRAFYQTFGAIIASLLSGNLTQAAGIAWLGFVAAAWNGVAGLGSVMQAALSFVEAWVPGVKAVRDTVVAMFAGIGNAIMAGRWDLAGAIMMAKLYAAVVSGWASISNAWAASAAANGAAWDTMVFGLRTAWHTTSTALAASMLWIGARFRDVITSIINNFDYMVVQAKQAIGFLAGAVTGRMDIVAKAAARDLVELDKRYAERAKANTAKSTAEQTALKQDSKTTQQGIRSDYEKSMIGRVQTEQATRDANAAKVQAANSNVANLERQASQAAGGVTLSDKANAASDALAKAIEAANKERAKGAPEGMQFKAPSLASSAGNQLAKVESRGTFSAAAAIAALGARSDAPEQTARNTAQATKLLRLIADKPGPQFI